MSHRRCCCCKCCGSFNNGRTLLILMMMMTLAIGQIQTSNAKQPFNFTWPMKKAAEVEGDLILGGLMMIHERQDDITCGPVMPQGGIQVGYRLIYNLAND